MWFQLVKNVIERILKKFVENIIVIRKWSTIIFKCDIVWRDCLKLNKVAIVSKFGSKISEDAAEMISKKLTTKKIKVYTIAPVMVSGSEKVVSVIKIEDNIQ